MRSDVRAVAIAALAVVLGASAPPLDSDVADATFSKGFTTFTGEQAFALMPEAGVCHHLKFLASFHVPGHPGDTKDNKIPVGAPIHLWAQTFVYAGEGYPGYLKKAYFAMTATFTPKLGAHYLIHQDMRFPIHRLEIVDEKTGSPPDDLTLAKGQYCGGYM